jgi:Adenylate kinase
VLDVLTPVVVEAAAGGGYILDGFPRNLPQAIAAAELAAQLGVTLDAAIYLYAPDEVLTRRLLDRASQGGRADDVADGSGTGPAGQDVMTGIRHRTVAAGHDSVAAETLEPSRTPASKGEP